MLACRTAGCSCASPKPFSMRTKWRCPARWHDLIGEPTLADAILDRTIHNAHRLQVTGDSLRKQNRPKTVAA